MSHQRLPRCQSDAGAAGTVMVRDVVTRQVAVPDTAAAITEAVREALSRVSGILTSGAGPEGIKTR